MKSMKQWYTVYTVDHHTFQQIIYRSATCFMEWPSDFRSRGSFRWTVCTASGSWRNGKRLGSFSLGLHQFSAGMYWVSGIPGIPPEGLTNWAWFFKNSFSPYIGKYNIYIYLYLLILWFPVGLGWLVVSNSPNLTFLEFARQKHHIHFGAYFSDLLSRLLLPMLTESDRLKEIGRLIDRHATEKEREPEMTD